MTRHVTLSGNRIKTKDALHAFLAKKLNFPDYYGKNLDALHDCLGAYRTPLHITVTYTEQIKENLGSYGETFLQLLHNITEKNRLISISLYADKRE